MIFILDHPHMVLHEMPSNLLATQPGTIAIRDLRITHIPQYKVLLHNDDKNTMEHVVSSLIRVFKFERKRCEQIMIEAHTNGVSLCAIESFEQAEHHRDQLSSFTLITTIEPV